VECRIYSPTLDLVSVIFSFNSLLWEEKYNDVGTAQLVIPRDSSYFTAMNTGNYIGIPESDTLMRIHSIQDQDDTIWCYASEAKIILDEKIYAKTTVCDGNVEETLKDRVQEFIDIGFMPDEIEVAPSIGLPGITKSECVYFSLGQISRRWCGNVGYGYKMVFDKTRKKLIYTIYSGSDKTNVKVSNNFGNLYNYKSSVSDMNYRDCFYIGGEGEGANRVFAFGGYYSDPKTRREVFIDAKNVVRQEGQDDQDYATTLIIHGMDMLSEMYNRTQSLTFDVDPYLFGEEIFLGDIITCITRSGDRIVQLPITEYSIIYENNTKKVSIVVGTQV
jgi:hypothetical protein